MKSSVSSPLALTAILALSAFTPAFAAPAGKPAATHPVIMVDHAGNNITRGTGISEVLRILGMPNRKLTADVWAYANFSGGQAQHPKDDCGTLLLRFRHGRVSDIRLVNDRAEKIYAAQLRATVPASGQVAAK
jgi:hypothetical protein